MAWDKSKISWNSTQRSPRKEPPQALGDGEQEQGGRLPSGQPQLRLSGGGVQAVPGQHPGHPQPQGDRGRVRAEQGAGEDCCQLAAGPVLLWPRPHLPNGEAAASSSQAHPSAAPQRHLAPAAHPAPHDAHPASLDQSQIAPGVPASADGPRVSPAVAAALHPAPAPASQWLQPGPSRVPRPPRQTLDTGAPRLLALLSLHLAPLPPANLAPPLRLLAAQQQPQPVSQWTRAALSGTRDRISFHIRSSHQWSRQQLGRLLLRGQHSLTSVAAATDQDDLDTKMKVRRVNG